MERKLACPACGSSDLGGFVDLRRCYGTIDAYAEFDADNKEVERSFMFEGWGDQVGDELDYLVCNRCSDEFKIEAAALAPAEPPEPDEERVNVEYTVEISVRGDQPAPTEEDLKRAIYQQTEVDSEDAVHVVRA